MRKQITQVILSLFTAIVLLAACTVGIRDNIGHSSTTNDSTNTTQSNTQQPGTQGGSQTSDPTTDQTTEQPTDPVDESYVAKYQPATDRTSYVLEDDHGVLGEGIGVNPGRVVWEYDPDAFNWDGTGYWCLARNYDIPTIKAMVEDGICSLAGEEDIQSAWDAIFSNFNWRVNGTSKDRAYVSGEKIVIKANMNGLSPVNGPTKLDNTMFTPPVLLRELLLSLVEYGVSPSDITVYDASRVIPTYMQEYCSDGVLSGVKFVYNARNGNRSQDAVADTTRPVVWSEEFEAAADQVFYPTCVTEADYMINVSSLKPHSLAGITGSAKNHFGSVMAGKASGDSYTFPNDFRDNPPTAAGLHPFVAAMEWNYGPDWTFAQRPMGTYTVLTDLLSNAYSGGKTVLYLMDGLAVTPDHGSQLTSSCKWITMGGGYTNSLLFSQDPIALDSVSYDFIIAELEAQAAVGQTHVLYANCLPEGHTAQNYLHESALAYNPPSGTYYQDGLGNLIGSLGVHEHWNNATDKQYSRNLGKDEGIELVRREHS